MKKKEIILRAIQQGLTNEQIAKKYKVHPSYIYAVKKGKKPTEIKTQERQIESEDRVIPGSDESTEWRMRAISLVAQRGDLSFQKRLDLILTVLQ